jgi:cell division protein FtsI (penicillin-binding protein 3)
MVPILEPSPGRDVVLTIDVDLQEIAADALREALATTNAESAEMVIVDPHTGEVLAAVSSARGERRTTWAAATEPYEPGSTIKPFTIAALLSEERATLDDRFHGENGSYRLNGRTINDVNGHEWLTLREAFLVSSNIVMAKAAARLGNDAQYQRLRDFGFGSPTGIGYPGESAGRLWSIERWSRQSPASLAFGYEIAVTPLQLAMAYAAIANGGVLLEPVLVREVRARDGTVQRTAPHRVVRRVLDSRIAAQVRSLLGEVVERGTGQNAALGEWKVAGKTGTARFAANGRYVPGAYIATFAGFFPADDPQIVFLVKLDRPRGDYYGGLTAAPVTRATLQAALAARGTPLDRSQLAGIEWTGRTESGTSAGQSDAEAGAEAGEASATDGSCWTCTRFVSASDREAVVLRPAVAVRDGTAKREAAVVPDVSGEPVRDAVRVLHAAGFSVRLEGSGEVVATEPAAGQQARLGRTVVVRARGAR